MEFGTMASLEQAPTAPTSRRGLLAVASSGLLAAWQLADGAITSEAKKKRNRKRKRKNNRKKNDRTVTRVDAICSGPIVNAALGLSEGASLAQTFTALNSGRLVRAELPISADETGSADLILQLRDINASGVPTEEVFAEALVASSDVPDRQATVSFAFAEPPTVAANREYALVLSKRGSRILSWSGLRDDTCDGRAFRRNSATEPFEVPPPFDLDLIFTTIVEL